jgi:hypothetical protein
LLLAPGLGAVAPVNLGSASRFTILAKTGISTTRTTAIVGDIGLSPAAASFITGFGPIMDSSGQFSTSSLVTGKIYASDYAPPTPAKMTAAIGDMQTAYTSAAGAASGSSNLGGGTLSNLTLAPGVYSWGTNVAITNNLTLAGSSSDVWIFQISGTLDVSSGVQIILSGGAQVTNIFWQVAGQTTLGTTSAFCGNILDQTAVVMNTGASLKGRALAQSAVTLDGNSVISYQFAGSNPPAQGNTFAYPSPARGGVVNIVYDMQSSGQAEVRIYNDHGDLAASQKNTEPSGAQVTQFQVHDFAPGVYLYKVVLTYDSGSSESLPVQKFGVIK